MCDAHTECHFSTLSDKIIIVYNPKCDQIHLQQILEKFCCSKVKSQTEVWTCFQQISKCNMLGLCIFTKLFKIFIRTHCCGVLTNPSTRKLFTWGRTDHVSTKNSINNENCQVVICVQCLFPVSLVGISADKNISSEIGHVTYRDIYCKCTVNASLVSQKSPKSVRLWVKFALRISTKK